MKLQTLFTKFNRTARMAVGALVVGGALVVSSGQAYAASYLSTGQQCRSDWSQHKYGVYLFSDINYQGRCTRLTTTPSTITTFNMGDLGEVGNDAVSSVEIFHQNGNDTYEVELYEHDGRGGQILHLTGSTPDLTKKTMSLGKNANDVTSSVTVFQWHVSWLW